VQFTPDLMPSDITGSDVLEEDRATGRRVFRFVKGPLFAHVILADEINRTPPKTQAALLQAMNERFVTIDAKDYALGDEFLVVATQNPIEQQGTYPLPEAQLDRFLFKIVIDYPTRDEEREIVQRHGHRSAMPRLADFDLAAVATAADLAYARATVANIRLSDVLIDYIVDVVRATREHVSIATGASTRAANMLASAARAFAATQGRDFVIPDDVKALAIPLMRHRIVLSPSAEIEGLATDQVLRDILDQTAAPR
jgi:MoxR-like ATPase